MLLAHQASKARQALPIPAASMELVSALPTLAGLVARPIVSIQVAAAAEEEKLATQPASEPVEELASSVLAFSVGLAAVVQAFVACSSYASCASFAASMLGSIACFGTANARNSDVAQFR